MTAYSKRSVLALTLAVVAALARPAAGQELLVGYQTQTFHYEGDSLTAPFGVNISVAGPTSGMLSVVGQFDWSRKHESETVFGTSIDASASFMAFAGGVRLSGRGNRKVTPFVDTLFGMMRSSGSASVAGTTVDGSTETDPVFQFGGGVSVPVGGVFGVFGQLDYRRIFAEDVGVNAIRFVAGIRMTGR